MAETTFQAPSNEELQEEALRHLKQQDPKSYRLMTERGRAEYASLQAHNCRDEAEARCKQGEQPQKAWHAAMREILAGVPED